MCAIESLPKRIDSEELPKVPDKLGAATGEVVFIIKQSGNFDSFIQIDVPFVQHEF